ncbi:MAG TPA: methyl-accepting chemotaxis protein [Stellaceae bacterium]|nr:methyl-accepting chemotaxis protein [Stellaceae bacterium]
MNLNRFRITWRIYAGFGLLVVLGLTLALMGVWEFSSTGGQVDTLVTTSDHATRIIQMSRMLETMRRAALRYQTKSDPEMIKEFTGAHERVSELLAQSIKDALSEMRRDMYRQASDPLAGFKADFDQLVKLSNAASNGSQTLAKLGGEVVSGVNKATEIARGLGDAAASAAVRNIEVAVLTTRLASARFTIFKDPALLDQVHGAASSTDKAILEAGELIHDDALRAQIATLKSAFDAYVKAGDEASVGVLNTDQLYEKTMVPKIVSIQQMLAKASESMANDFDGVKTATRGELASATRVQEAFAVVALLIGIALALVIGRSISGPLGAMTAAMRRLAGGDKSVEIPARDGRDEIAEMAKAVDVFKENMIRADQLALEQRAEQEKKEQRQGKIEEYVTAFDDVVRNALGKLGTASTEMRGTAESMSATAEETSRQATAVAAATEQASTNVQTVASASEQLSSSISEIGRQVEQSSSITKKAVDQAKTTSMTVDGLAKAAQRIGDVVKLIQDIASQTNLLALNATIEAARAGEAGRGYAVVASEVKTLANQTAKATEEISGQILEIQTATGETVSAIESIGQTIAQVNEISSAIASAVQEQSAATQEIAGNVQQASRGTAEITQNIAGVTQAASEAGAASTQVLGSASELSKQADRLRGEVDSFLAKIRAA